MEQHRRRLNVAKEIASSNRGVVITATSVISVLYSWLAFKTENYLFLYVHAYFVASVFLSFYIAKKGFVRFSHYVFLFAGNLVIFMYADSLPHTSLMHLFFLLAMLFPVFVLPFRNWRRAVFPTVFPMMAWSFCLLKGPFLLFTPAKHPEAFSPFFAMIAVVGVLATFGISAHLRFLRLYAEVVKHSEELVHKNRMAAIGAMAAEVAHEINNPLTLILGKAERIQRRTRAQEVVDDQIEADAQRVIQTVHRIARSVSKLKDSSHGQDHVS